MQNSKPIKHTKIELPESNIAIFTMYPDGCSHSALPPMKLEHSIVPNAKCYLSKKVTGELK